MKIWIVAEISPVSRDMVFSTSVYTDPWRAQNDIKERLNVPVLLPWDHFLAEDYDEREIIIEPEDDIIGFWSDSCCLTLAVCTI